MHRVAMVSRNPKVASGAISKVLWMRTPPPPRPQERLLQCDDIVLSELLSSDYLPLSLCSRWLPLPVEKPEQSYPPVRKSIIHS